jgi:cell division protein FtsB
MISPKKIYLILGVALVLFMVYSSILGSTGILERKNLESKIRTIQDEVEKLELENKALLNRNKLYSKEDKVLESEAVRHYLLNEDSRIIKFKELIEIETEEDFHPTAVSISTFPYKKNRKFSDSIQFLKVFYLVVTVVLGISLILRFKKT